MPSTIHSTNKTTHATTNRLFMSVLLARRRCRTAAIAALASRGDQRTNAKRPAAKKGPTACGRRALCVRRRSGRRGQTAGSAVLLLEELLVFGRALERGGG